MKKIISILLAVIMTATLLCAAVPAFAAEADVILYCNGEDFGELSWQEAYDLVTRDALGTKGVTSNYKIKLLRNIELTSQFNPQNNVNIEIDGLLANGQKAIINSTVTTNNWRLQGGAKYVFRNVVLKGQATEGCLIQLNHKQLGGDVDIIDCVIESSEQYFTINVVAESGVQQTVNIIRSEITQKGYSKSTDTAIRSRSIIGTSNPGAQYMHLELNIIDSTLKSDAGIIWVNKGSTADINVVNSTLELVENPNGYTSHVETSYLPKMGAVVIDKVEDLKGVQGLPTTVTFDAENSIVKACSGAETFVLADDSNIIVNYSVGEPNTEVTSPLDNIVTGLPGIVTDAPTTTAPDEEEDDATTTTAAEEEDDVTTTAADDEEDDEADETTTAAADEEADTTTAAPDVTTAAPATDAEGGCAGCTAGDGATAAIALAVAMAAAVAIVVKRK